MMGDMSAAGVEVARCRGCGEMGEAQEIPLDRYACPKCYPVNGVLTQEQIEKFRAALRGEWGPNWTHWFTRPVIALLLNTYEAHTKQKAQSPPCMNYREYGGTCLKGAGHEGNCGGHLPGCTQPFDCGCPGAVSAPFDNTSTPFDSRWMHE